MHVYSHGRNAVQLINMRSLKVNRHEVTVGRGQLHGGMRWQQGHVIITVKVRVRVDQLMGAQLSHE
jgi:hypothetical protein